MRSLLSCFEATYLATLTRSTTSMALLKSGRTREDRMSKLSMWPDVALEISSTNSVEAVNSVYWSVSTTCVASLDIVCDEISIPLIWPTALFRASRMASRWVVPMPSACTSTSLILAEAGGGVIAINITAMPAIAATMVTRLASRSRWHSIAAKLLNMALW